LVEAAPWQKTVGTSMGRRKNEAGISAEKNGEKPALDGDRMVLGPLALREGLGAADLVSGRPSSAENYFPNDWLDLAPP
jgi:hypothetical protein